MIHNSFSLWFSHSHIKLLVWIANISPFDYIDESTSDFPGMTWNAEDKRFFGPHPNDEAHPHLRLKDAMVSMPLVEPGDMVFWHCVSEMIIMTFQK